MTHEQIQQFLHPVQQRVRRETSHRLVITSLFLLNSAGGLGLAGWILVSRDVTGGTIWPLAVIQALAILVLAFLARRLWKRKRQWGSMIEAPATRMATMITDTRAAIHERWLILACLLVVTPLLLYGLKKTIDSGAMSTAQGSTMMLIICGFALLISAHLLGEIFRTLHPRLKHLQTLDAAMRDTSD